MDIRINRINKSLQIEERDGVSELFRHVKDEQGATVFDVHEPALLNKVYEIIANIANLKNHLKKYSLTQGYKSVIVEDYINAEPSLQVIIDLYNIEKHGTPL
ncbi:hypothetical protein GYB57_09545 [bacterium]|nr:hypothetical protein [bacterium]